MHPLVVDLTKLQFVLNGTILKVMQVMQCILIKVMH